MNPKFTYRETGIPWHWGQTVLSIVVLCLLVGLFVFNLTTGGGVVSLLIVTICFAGAIIAIIQMRIPPVLEIKFDEDQITITHWHGSLAYQVWDIKLDNVLKIDYVENTWINLPYLKSPLAERISDSETQRLLNYFHVITVKPHISGIGIDSYSTHWIIGITDPKLVIDELGKIIKVLESRDLDFYSNEDPIIVVEKVRTRKLKPVRIYMHDIRLAFLIMAVVLPGKTFTESIPLGWGLGICIIMTACFLLLPFAGEKHREFPIIKAYKNRLQIRTSMFSREMVTIPAEDISFVGTVEVFDGDPQTQVKYTEGCSAATRVLAFHALVIHTKTEKWLFYVPYPVETAEILERIYCVESETA